MQHLGDSAIDSKTDALRELVQLDHVMGQEYHDRPIGRIGLPPFPIGSPRSTHVRALDHLAAMPNECHDTSDDDRFRGSLDWAFPIHFRLFQCP
jgi:hypothetical protein